MLAGGLLVVAVVSAATWALTFPQGGALAPPVRALADITAVGTLGLAAVPLLEDLRHRAELARSAATPLAVCAASWVIAELARLIVVAAQAAALPVERIGLHTVTEFALHTAVGRSGLVGVVAALGVGLSALAAPRTAAATTLAVGLAAVGLTARTLTGHLSESPVGGLAVTVHALAAAAWCGVLAALVLTVTHRGQWARVLPRFSQLSLGCVAVLLAAGVTAALIRLNSPTELWATGYGRVLSAKIVTTAVLVVLARQNRLKWLPAARSHRASAQLSRSRSLTELAIMTVALTLAAALAVTG